MSEVLISGTERKAERPDPAWVVGTPCPYCGEEVVSNCYRVSKPAGNAYYLLVHECWASLGATPTCQHRRVV